MLLLLLFSSSTAQETTSPNRAGQRVYYTISALAANKNKNYGFSPESPVKVGRSETGGGAGNERSYFELLRDAQGRPVGYKKLGSCCAYKSENGIMGNALLNRYEISYTDEKGVARKKIVFTSHYDYEEPRCLFGFSSLNNLETKVRGNAEG